MPFAASTAADSLENSTPFVAAVVCNGNGKGLTLRVVLIQIVCKALCRLAHRVDVHAIRACANDTAKAAGAEGKVSVKTVVYLPG